MYVKCDSCYCGYTLDVPYDNQPCPKCKRGTMTEKEFDRWYTTQRVIRRTRLENVDGIMDEEGNDGT